MEKATKRENYSKMKGKNPKNSSIIDPKTL